MKHSEFAIGRFENRNGVISWRVTGWLHGERVRRNFKTREEAAAEKATLEIDAEAAASGLSRVTTSLNLDQVRQTEAVFRRLEGKKHTLEFCVDYTLANYRAPDCEKLLGPAVDTYVAAKTEEAGRGIISVVQVGSIKKELTLLKAHFGEVAVATLTLKGLVGFCERGKPSLKTFNNRRGILSTFFKYAFQQDWIAVNPIEKMPYRRWAARGVRGRELDCVAGGARGAGTGAIAPH